MENHDKHKDLKKVLEEIEYVIKLTETELQRELDHKSTIKKISDRGLWKHTAVL
ncbi:MAG: hypothetical protein KBS60_02770 [Phascolarctobacterium sp.]|nr:hypothetical protein [Candidatus Phascolarctobacterium caballi]